MKIFGKTHAFWAALVTWLVAGQLSAHAALTLTLSDGTPGDTKTYTDGSVSGFIEGGLGSAPSFISIGNWTVGTGWLATSYPVNGTVSDPYYDFLDFGGGLSRSSGSSTLTATLTETGLPAALFSSGSLAMVINTSVGNPTPKLTALLNSTQIGSINAGSSGAQLSTVPVSGAPSMFSLTETMMFTSSSYVANSEEIHLILNSAPIPEPADYGALAGAGLLALLVRRRIFGKV